MKAYKLDTVCFTLCLLTTITMSAQAFVSISSNDARPGLTVAALRKRSFSSRSSSTSLSSTVSNKVGVGMNRRSFRLPKAPQTCFSLFCRDCPPPSLMLCGVINDDNESDSGSEISFNADVSASGAAAAKQPAARSGLFGGVALKDNLLKVSNYASMLCVLDCTVLPLVTFILPLFGIVAASPVQLEWLHELGHSLALYFVMPVGGFAVTMNYTRHKKMWISSLGLLGLVCVLSANIGCHAVHLPGAVGHFIHHLLHDLHHGILHRAVNLAGCFLLLTSNFLSRKQGVSCADPSCDHKH